MPPRTSRLRRLAIWPLAALLVVAGCDSDPAQPGDDDDDDPPSTLLIRVQGTSMGPLEQNVRLYEGDLPLAGATVTVNGVALNETDTGYYQGRLPALLDAGAEVRLRVESQGRVVEGVGSIPDRPVLTTPVEGSYLDRSGEVAFGWTSSSNPDLFRLSLGWTAGTVSSSTGMEAAGSVREAMVSPSEVPEEVDAVYATVTPYNRGSFTGPADSQSDMSIRVLAQSTELALEPPLEIRGADMGSRFQNLWIYSDGEPVGGAVVTVNGVSIGEAGTGYYSGQLPTALAAGEELRLRVESGSRVVEGVVMIVETPVLTAPVAGQYFDPLADLDYTWTADQDPDLFALHLAWVKNGGGSSTVVSAPGNARSGVVSPAAVPDDPESVSASVFAYLRGEFTGPAHPDSDMRVRLEGPPTALALEPPLLIEGGAMSTFSQNVRISAADEPVSGATVTANGVVLNESSAGFYQGQLPALLGPDEELRLRVEWNGRVVEGLATIVEAPVLSSPTQGQVFVPNASVDYAWVAARDADYYEMRLSWVKNGSGTGIATRVPGATRSGSMPTTAVPDAPESLRAQVYAFLRGTFTGPAHPDSDMRVRFSGGAIDFTITPPQP